jgi:hypothetical protein
MRKQVKVLSDGRNALKKCYEAVNAGGSSMSGEAEGKVSNAGEGTVLFVEGLRKPVVTAG